ncbi:carbon starvation protein A [Marinimicrobium sp. ABcell2]|uniref:carbon starvation CstA family protein n=1 Tax=Marinimicrobium sp. ABcell2 TaxID=3069751 RepID=UPI0027B1360C|nr:carbon starvation protein A [Marinimicrobium sp. ABcell2]MDQ2076437.1 carbon starvation protein A [Marinimicrobium sp. ABcell2]
MYPILVALGGFLAFYLGWRFYSRFLAERLFKLDPDAVTPAHKYNDGLDFMPTDRFVLLGHHFSSVAGAAPIIGPAIAVIWGWLPALIWILLGTVFIAGMHDMSTLWASVRHKARSIGNIATEVLGPRAKSLFLLLIFFLLLMVNAVFAVAIATLFVNFPGSLLPYWLQIPIAITIGVLAFRTRIPLLIPCLIGLALLVGLIFVGAQVPVSLPSEMAGVPDSAWWVLIMLGYGALASRLPVWILLQPRDFINSHLLFIGLALLYLGLFVAQPEFAAPMINTQLPGDTPPIIPLLFVTVACGAISGFHGLVSSGTSSRQLNRETDARFVGYLGATGEGLLALAALLAVSAGFAGMAEWGAHYDSWASASAGGIAAFALGAGNLLSSLGLPVVVGSTLVSTMVVCFAATTLDTSMRLQRFILAEIGRDYKMPALSNVNLATLITFISCAALAFLADPDNPGGGGMMLWPLFGTTNQLMAGLSLLVVTLLLWKLRRPVVYTLVPFLLVATMTAWAMLYNLSTYLANGSWMLLIMGGMIFALNIWLLLEGAVAARRLMRERRQEVQDAG